jgi:hypothetical protein
MDVSEGDDEAGDFIYNVDEVEFGARQVCTFLTLLRAC